MPPLSTPPAPPAPPILHACVTPHPLDVPSASTRVAHPGAGAIATFVGTTRDTFGGLRTLGLEYEAYVPMAEAKLMAWLGVEGWGGRGAAPATPLVLPSPRPSPLHSLAHRRLHSSFSAH